MSYYPKSKILTNQVATQNMIGSDGLAYNYVFVNNNQYYQGDFYILYNGKTYTGKYPGDGVNEEIIKLIDDVDAYDGPTAIVPSLTTTNIPPLYPTPKDYKAGVFTRYFTKKRNEFIFDELTKDQYSNINTTLYIKFSIQWQLVGDKDATYISNRNMVLLAEQKNKVPGLTTYLKEDYLKYYK